MFRTTVEVRILIAGKTDVRWKELPFPLRLFDVEFAKLYDGFPPNFFSL